MPIVRLTAVLARITDLQSGRPLARQLVRSVLQVALAILLILVLLPAAADAAR